jgi:sec-independent protein translocase protein TatB
MEILGIGPMELVFILIIALIVLGPKDMAKAGRTLGKFMRDVVKSDTWKTIRTTTRELELLPNRLMREAGLEDDLKNLHNLPRSVTADELTNSIKPPTVPPGNSTPGITSPEDAAFTQVTPSDPDGPSESQPPQPSLPPNA